MMKSLGSAAWIARHAMRGDILSGSRLRARSFQVVPGSSSSWSIDASCCCQAERVWWISALRSSRPDLPASADSFASRRSATSLASPWMATATFLVRPMRSALTSTWITLASFGQ